MRRKKNRKSITDAVTIREILEKAAKRFSGNTAFVVKEKTNAGRTAYVKISYSEFMCEVRTLGTALLESGYKRIGIIGDNSYEWALTYYGAVCSGLVAVPLDKGLPAEEIAGCLERSRVDALFFDKAHEKVVLEATGNGTIEKEATGNGAGEDCLGVRRWEGARIRLWDNDYLKYGRICLLSGSVAYDRVEIGKNQTATILFTSGTSGNAKAVVLSHENIASNVCALNRYVDFYESDVNMAFLPFHHTFGNTSLLLLLSNGASNVFCDGLKYVQKNLCEYGVSVFVGVPLLIENIYNKLLKEIAKQGKTARFRLGLELSGKLKRAGIDARRKIFASVLEGLGGKLRLIVSGAAALDRDVAKGFNDIGVSLIQGYGMTETSPVISGEKPGSDTYGSVGMPLDNVFVKLKNCDENGVGELLVKGPSVMKGYYEDEAANAEVFEYEARGGTEESENPMKNCDRWLRTGDLAWIGGDGTIYLKGRCRNVIVLRNGKNVFPEELEALVNKLPYVKECIVYGQMRNENDPVVTLRAVVDPPAVGDGTDIGAALLERLKHDVGKINEDLPVYKRILRFEITDAVMEKTTTQKIKRYKVLVS